MNKVDIIRVKIERTGEIIHDKPIKSPDDIVDLLKKRIGDSDREIFVVLHLNTKNEVTAYEEVSIGSINATIVHPREVFKSAICNNAAKIILSHNHPSGNPKPSKEDIQITNRINDAGEIIGISVLDHVIIGDNTYYSLKENGLL